MTGPDHYREAQKCLATADTCDLERESYWLGRAQVHATLALAAATAMAADADGGVPRMPIVDFQAWDAAAGVRP